MSFGKPTPAQCQAIQAHVSGKTVHDVGAGSLEMTKELLALGARRIVAIDKEKMPSPPKRVTTVRSYFHDYTKSVQTAFVSWPVNWVVEGLLPILERAKMVVYLGKNTDGCMCGFLEMWKYLSTRNIIEHVPEQANTLIIYGATQRKRTLLPEERAAMDHEKIWSFHELYFSESRLLGSTGPRT